MLTHKVTEQGGTTVLSFEGSLDALTVPEVRPTVEDLARRGNLKVVVDMTAVTVIDSSGVAIIVSLFKRLRGLGGAVRVAGVNGQPKEIFHFLRLEQALPIFATVADAQKGY